MKKVMTIWILVLFCCKSGNYSWPDSNRKVVLIYYSKGPCLGKCPVYDFWVFTDGTYLYKEANKTKRNRTDKGHLAQDEVDNLTLFLKNHLGYPSIFRPIRDRPKTILRFDQREFEYYSSKIDGPLKEVDTKIEALVKSVTAGEHAN